MSRVAQAMVCLPCVACVGLAGAGMLRGVDGWGWFLFVACLLVPNVTSAIRDTVSGGTGERGES